MAVDPWWDHRSAGELRESLFLDVLIVHNLRPNQKLWTMFSIDHP
jgi:hypothetical protein